MGAGVFWLMAAIFAGVYAALTALYVLLRRRAAENRRRSDQAHEQELLERVGAGLAHELKNPLGALNLNVQLLEEELEARGALGEASRARLATIKKEYRRLEDVLNDFLRYAGHRTLAPTEVDLNAVVGELITFVRPEFHRRNVALEGIFAEGPVKVKADEGLMKQALLNVLLNAMESISGGGSVTVSTRTLDGEAEIAVRDTGSGISKEDIEHVFEAYFSRKEDGTGLGLAITKRIIEDHNGSIKIDSAPGAGTFVTIILPAEGPGHRREGQ